jgi:hypothetical protein
MKLTITSRSEEAAVDCDYRRAVKYDLESEVGTVVVKFSDGEPEDANLSRDFSDVHSIPMLLKWAHAAGERGEIFEVEEIESDEI